MYIVEKRPIYRVKSTDTMKPNTLDVTVRFLEELAAPVFWGPTLAPLEDASEFVAVVCELATTALEP